MYKFRFRPLELTGELVQSPGERLAFGRELTWADSSLAQSIRRSLNHLESQFRYLRGNLCTVSRVSPLSWAKNKRTLLIWGVFRTEPNGFEFVWIAQANSKLTPKDLLTNWINWIDGHECWQICWISVKRASSKGLAKFLSRILCPTHGPKALWVDMILKGSGKNRLF